MNTSIALILFFTLAGHAGPGLARLQMREESNCDATAVFRTIDGKCNNLDNPSFGASDTPFSRFIPAMYSGDGTAPRIARSGMPLPNARLISSSLHPDRNVPDSKTTNAFIMFAMFVAGVSETPFMVVEESDPIGSCCGANMESPKCDPISPIVKDPFFSVQREPRTCLPQTRSMDCFSSDPECAENSQLRVDTSGFELREQVNGNPSYVDLSSVYGFNDNLAGNLRSGSGGKLRSLITAAGNELLPILSDPIADEVDFTAAVGQCLTKTSEDLASGCVFQAGDIRARANPLLTMWHTLWLREHNRVASALASFNPQLTDEELYQNARRCVIAEFQNIIYSEELPTLLGADAITTYGLEIDGGDGYNPEVDGSVRNSFATAAYRFGHSMTQGTYLSTSASGDSTTVKLRDIFGDPSLYAANGGEGADELLRGLMEQPSQAFDSFITEDLTNFLFPLTPTACTGDDLAARDITRGRDHGLPGYLSFLKFCGLSDDKSTSKLKDHHHHHGYDRHNNAWSKKPSTISLKGWKKLQHVYESPEDIDLLTAGYFETPVSGGLTGPVFTCLMAKQFQMSRAGDRFFFTHTDQVGSFTGGQIAALKSRSLRDVICDNFPGITETRSEIFLLNSPFESCAQRTNLDLSMFAPAAAAPDCPPEANDFNCCTASKPCGLNQGDCDNDNQCQGSSICGTQNCQQINPVANAWLDCCTMP